jgi:hypothetical protein
MSLESAGGFTGSARFCFVVLHVLTVVWLHSNMLMNGRCLSIYVH